MDNTLYIALSRQTALWRQMDMIANNMANMNTPAFKGEQPLFVEYLEKTKTPNSQLGSKLSFVEDYGSVLDFAEGPLTSTGNSLDVAIHGDGFFVVDTPEGERYTRNGHFKLDEQGQLMSSDGHAVLSKEGQPFFFAPNESQINIARDGTISTENGVIGSLKVVNFNDPQKLTKLYGGLYETAADNQPQDLKKVDVQQAMLESSNVQPVVEMTRMISVQRAYENTQRMIEGEHSRQKLAVDTLARKNRA